MSRDPETVAAANGARWRPQLRDVGEEMNGAAMGELRSGSERKQQMEVWQIWQTSQR